MQWFLTDQKTIIPETAIVKICPGPNELAMAYVLDRRGVMDTVTLTETFEQLIFRLTSGRVTLSPAIADEDDHPPARKTGTGR